MGRKKVYVALLLAIFPGMVGLRGLGQIYTGHLKRGLILLFIGLILSACNNLVPVISYNFCFYHPTFNATVQAVIVCFWVWQTWDAWRLCRENNRLARETC